MATARTAPTTPVEPQEPGPPLPIQPAAEQGVPLGSPPRVAFRYCTAAKAGVDYFVRANQQWLVCSGLPPPLVEFVALYCGEDGLDEEARLCSLYHSTVPSSEAEAESTTSSWIANLSRSLGPAVKRKPGEVTWTRGDVEITVGTGPESDRDAYAPFVLYESAEGRASNSDRAHFPTGAGGFEFGFTLNQAKAECERRRGVFAPTSDAPAPGFQCLVPQVDSPLQIRIVSGLFCEGRLCEISLTLNDDEAHTAALLSKKYGPTDHYRDENPKCRPNATRRMWLWHAHNKGTIGVVRLLDDCFTQVLYDNSDGWYLRLGQDRERSNTY